MSAIATDLARSLDPVALAEQVGMVPDEWQARALRSRASRVLMNCCRQSGKTTILGLAALHQALYEEGSLTLVLSASERQARELFRTALVAYRVIGRPVAPEAENRLSLELENGSRIVVVPAQGATIRGYSAVRLLLVDEAAQVDDAVYMAARPFLAISSGRLILASTPFGRRGFFWEAWRSREPWQRFEVPASECPRIPAAFLEEERRAMGPWFYAQEYEATFMDAQSAAFRQEDVEAAFDPEVESWAL